jgi:hypothetical protein
MDYIYEPQLDSEDDMLEKELFMEKIFNYKDNKKYNQSCSEKILSSEEILKMYPNIFNSNLDDIDTDDDEALESDLSEKSSPITPKEKKTKITKYPKSNDPNDKFDLYICVQSRNIEKTSTDFELTDQTTYSTENSEENKKKRGRPKGSKGTKSKIVEHKKDIVLDENLENYKLKELMDIAKYHNIKGITGKKKSEVIQIMRSVIH